MATSSSQGGRCISLTYHSSVYPIPRSPEVTRTYSGRSPVPLRFLDTPLSAYAATRQRTRVQFRPRAATRQNKVPLSTLTPAKAEPGSVGGDFKPATMFTSIHLPTLYNHHQVTQKGIRNVRIHSDRYSPATVARDPFADAGEPRDRPQQQLRGERVVEVARMRKAASAHVPHRAEFGFYMSGRSAQLFRKGELSAEELQQLKLSSLSPNSALYYGKGVKSGRPHSKAVQEFEKKLQLTSESSGGEMEGRHEGGVMEQDAHTGERDARQETPPPSPVPLSPTLSGAADTPTNSVFITESKSKPDQ